MNTQRGPTQAKHQRSVVGTESGGLIDLLINIRAYRLRGLRRGRPWPARDSSPLRLVYLDIFKPTNYGDSPALPSSSSDAGMRGFPALRYRHLTARRPSLNDLTMVFPLMWGARSDPLSIKNE